MSYREATYARPCYVCQIMTSARCRRCGLWLCPSHSAEFQFFVPAVQCVNEADCRPFETTPRPTKSKRPQMGDFYDASKWRK